MKAVALFTILLSKASDCWSSNKSRGIGDGLGEERPRLTFHRDGEAEMKRLAYAASAEVV